MLKLNCGCGMNFLEGWENLDINPIHPYSSYFDLTNLPYKYENESVDFIEIEHTAEHFKLEDFYNMLVEFRRILKVGGVLRIAVPSIVKIFNHNNPQYTEFLTARGWSDGTKEGDVRNILLNHGHQLFFHYDTLISVLSSLGFNAYECEIGKSAYPELNNIEGHWKALGYEFAELETIVVEGVKV
jgi:SAM-dependent methyltransferase